ncbi:G2/M phase-specific E3 ubiquitin-protein ligase-like isoform X1 [Esox lucius]|uniref:G2/M phase-specific E3 ubiquitin-protein ligase-like isoform X1 n=1 Tax=Esox lucius TaxID=8010 RepID=UPI001476E257|nr:G2/M phase-specific E3 ubiquitin-protein ligase-like isoform X1 [Esox lucius]
MSTSCLHHVYIMSTKVPYSFYHGANNFNVLSCFRDAPGQSSTIQPGQIVISDSEDLDPPETNPEKTPFYSKYTDLYSPNVEQEDGEPVAVNVKNFQHTAREETDIALSDIVANLSLPIDHKKVSRFNISRANVWDGAVRGFKRTTYSETCDMLVKFTDDTGVLEEGIDTGGPRREFLTLLMKHLKDQPIFDGPEGHRFLVYNANAVREDENYLAGKMIAVSVVHGGPGPHFLSEDLVHYLAGQPSFKATNNLITDEEIGKALQEIENAASLDALRECIMRHSTMLQTAGCLRHVATVDEKKEIVSDYLQWYIIDRNSSVIDRDSLSTLEFLTALQQHLILLATVLCHSERRLTAFKLECLFKPLLSPSGSNRRLKESQTIAYWADYLLDCEESQAAVSVEDVLMFATGLMSASLPPSGLEPLPQIEFLDDSASIFIDLYCAHFSSLVPEKKNRMTKDAIFIYFYFIISIFLRSISLKSMFLQCRFRLPCIQSTFCVCNTFQSDIYRLNLYLH